MIILSIDSATSSATCALLKDDDVLGEITFNYKKQHSVILMPMIDELLKNTNLTINDIDGFVYSKGPGSFTGLRIGMATIKGLSQGTGKPIVGVSSLDALAFNFAFSDGIICPILDALRGNVYSALYKFKNDNLERITDYSLINLDELLCELKKYDEPIYFNGDGVNKFKDKIKKELPNCHFAPSNLNIIKASSLGELGMKALNEGSFDDIYTASPIYLLKSQAEREYEKNKNKE